MLPKLDFNASGWNPTQHQRNTTNAFPSFIQEAQIEESANKLSELPGNQIMANYLNDDVPNYSQRPSQMSKRTTADQIVTGRLS